MPLDHPPTEEGDDVLEHNDASLDLDTALAYAGDPDVEFVQDGGDPNGPHGANPELDDEDDPR